MLDETPDQRLMERIANGDKWAFHVLVMRYLPKAHNIARRMLSSPEDAEEAVQDAFAKLWQHAARYDPSKAASSTWFYQILSNTCLNMARRKPFIHASIDELEDTLTDATLAQDSQLVAQQDSARIRVAVAALPERQRLAVILCYFEELSNAQAAATMGLHIKALEGLLVRARKKLKELLR
ncbi:MAG: sigma-70 family RNA polymerase sigma factor [Methylococcaceae bacterium]|jgi:RNA polymerase sigma-70 factor (ECF subfamily)